MPRIRTIKPEIALHEGLYDLEAETGLPIRFAWAVLPCHCDREGRFEWRPRRLGAQILPYDTVDFSRVLDALWTRGFLVRYAVAGREYGCIPSFGRHQVVNNRESASTTPSPEDPDAAIIPPDHEDSDASVTPHPRASDACPTPLVHALAEGKGTWKGTGKGRDTICAEPAADAPTPAQQASGDTSAADHAPDAHSSTARSCHSTDRERKQDRTPVVVELVLNDGATHSVTTAERDRLAGQFPAVDVDAELRKMEAWCDANSTRRKTRRGIRRFVANWLARAQDRGGSPMARTDPRDTRRRPGPAPFSRQEALEAHNRDVARSFAADYLARARRREGEEVIHGHA